MLFNSINFLIFFPVVTVIFFAIPKRFRIFWLLVTSYFFYMCWNPKYIILIGISTVVTFLSGLLLEMMDGKTQKNIVLFASIFINLTILGVFKYADLALQTLGYITDCLGFGKIDRRLDLLLPVGISFYTFQTLSYTIDVYGGW